MSSDWAPPLAAISHSLHLGGTTAFLAILARGLNQRGYSLPVIAFGGPNDHALDFSAAGAEIHLLDRGNRLIYEDRLQWAYAKLAEIRPRAVIANLGSESFELLRLVPSGVLRIGTVQSFHQPPLDLAGRFAGWCDAVVGVSEEICAYLKKMPELSRVNVLHIPYGIEFPKALLREISSGESLRAVYVGRLAEEQKRISRLVQLVHRSVDAGLRIHFTFIGSGPDEQKVRDLAANLANVTWTGPVPNSEVQRLLAAQDVLLLLSDYEGLPISLIEAMGQGVVPIVSDLPSGVGELVPEDCGFRVPIGDVAAAETILASLAADRVRLNAISDRARRHARELYGSDRMVERYLSLSAEGSPSCWKPTASIPAPLGLPTWMFSGRMRSLRRLFKKIAHRSRIQ